MKTMNYKNQFDSNVENRNEQKKAQSKKDKKELAIKIGKYAAAIAGLAGAAWGTTRLVKKVRASKEQPDDTQFEETK